MWKKKNLRWHLALFLLPPSILVIYTIVAGSRVSERMSSLHWELPSRVFAAPALLFPGAIFPEGDLNLTLGKLGYKEVVDTTVNTGQWKKSGSTYEVGVRSFQDFAGKFPATHLRIEYSDGQVSHIFELKNGQEKEIDTATLEPERIGDFFSSKHEQRTLVHLRQVPPILLEAIMAIEDRKFYSHWGISWTGIGRAFLHNLRGGHVAEGGSTLTQQLMKNFFLSPDRTYSRKIQELIMTLIVETLYSKDEIFEAYINEIYLGQRGSSSIRGFGEAAQFYFSKDIDLLTLAEQALLAGMISSPGKYSPYNNLNNAYERRGVVLKKLLEYDIISKSEYERAKTEPIQARGYKSDERLAPYFFDYLRSDVSQLSDFSLKNEGHQIFTTLDPILQRLAEAAVQKGLKDLGKKSQDMQVAFLAVHPKTGAVKAMIGGADYKTTQFNRATQVKRPIGSLMKPFVTAIALSPPEEGEKPFATLATKVQDKPATFTFEGRDWAPKNYENKYFGEVTVRTGIENSLNLAIINLASHIPFSMLVTGIQKFDFENIQALPSITLGAISSSPLIVARAYSALANQGLLTNLRGVLGVISPNGERLSPKSLELKQVLSPEVSFLVTHLLNGVVERGTARRIVASGVNLPVAGKTGTTDDNRDSWFVGYTPSLLTVIWIGKDDNSKTGFTGSSGALPIWIHFMLEAQKRAPRETFETPPDIEWFEIDRVKGCRGGSGETLKEAFLPGTQPTKCD